MIWSDCIDFLPQNASSSWTLISRPRYSLRLWTCPAICYRSLCVTAILRAAYVQETFVAIAILLEDLQPLQTTPARPREEKGRRCACNQHKNLGKAKKVSRTTIPEARRPESRLDQRDRQEGIVSHTASLVCRNFLHHLALTTCTSRISLLCRSERS